VFKKIIQSFTLLLIFAAPALGMMTAKAADTVEDAYGIMNNLAASELMPLMTELNLSPEYRTRDEGEDYLFLTDADSGLSFYAVPSACTDGKCVGIEFLVPLSNRQISSEAVDKYKKISFIKVNNMEADNYVSVSRYEIADYGIARGNLQASIENLLVLAKRVREEE